MLAAAVPLAAWMIAVLASHLSARITLICAAISAALLLTTWVMSGELTRE
ncbi:MAG: hypothetical protein H6810_06335 [Phycisphaeraceae bacterium]|nr:MAG: hypothetical protein H6810_06335 [Phycisphaeraceae bacterium]